MNVFIFASLWIATGAWAFQTDVRGLIEQALDEPAKVTLENLKLVEAIATLSQQTGIPIVIPDDTVSFAPYGRETVIEKVELTKMSVRQALPRLLSRLGMTYVVTDQNIRIVPKEAVYCLGRAPTWAELDLLAELSATEPGVDAAALEALRTRVQFQVETASPWPALSEALRAVGAGPGDEVLTVACEKLGWGWCLSDRRIVIESLERQVQRLLQQPITLRMNNRPLFEVMTEVGERVGVAVRAEPGALASLPLGMQQNFSLNVHQQSAAQVFEQIQAYTGLGYFVAPDGVVFYRVGPQAPGETSDSRRFGAAPSGGGAGASDPYVAKVVVTLADGKLLEWLIRESELPADLRRMRQQDLQDTLEQVRRRAAATPNR
jgi:type II secretory pathway component GspD/PulD (secretin)